VQLIAPPPEFGNAPSFFQLIDSKGEALAPRDDRFALPVPQRAIEVAKTGTGAYYTDVEVRGTALRMYVSPSRSGQALVAARSLSEVDDALSRLGWSLAITCLAGIALAGSSAPSSPAARSGPCARSPPPPSGSPTHTTSASGSRPKETTS
jgi:hypothetical protein